MCPSFNISHGTFTFENNSTQDLVPGTRVTIDCDDGYGPLNGSRSAVCQANTYTWSPITPGCDSMLHDCYETAHYVIVCSLAIANCSQYLSKPVFKACMISHCIITSKDVLG